MSLDLAALTAMDTHVHVERDAAGHTSVDEKLMAAYSEAAENRTPSVEVG